MSRLQANLLLLLTALIWGSSFVAQKFGAPLAGPFGFTAARFFLGALVVLPLALAELRRGRRQGRHLSGRDRLGLLCTGSALCCGAVLQQIGIASTSVTNAGFLTALYVPLVPIIGFVTRRAVPHPMVWPAAALSVLGTWMLSGGGPVSLAIGDAWVIASALFWAAHIILVGLLSARTGMPTVLALVQFLIAGSVSAVIVPFVEPQALSGLWEARHAIAYVGILSVGIGFTLQSVTQRYTNAADAAIILSGETLFAAIGGMLVLDERLTVLQFAGCAAILIAILAVQLLPVQQPASAR
jgi:drug/metabolite transporter (DMT)-like permease